MHRSLLSVCAILLAAASTIRAESATITLQADKPGPPLSRFIQGQFAEHLGACIYGGIWVGEDSPIPNTRGIRNDVVAALKELKVPVVRWPGGCFADEYHWKDGIGPRADRPSMMNTHWGKVVENNHFGTHEFFDLCAQIGTEPYVSANLGSGTVEEMMQWVEYMTSDADSPMPNLRRKHGRDQPWKLKFLGVGNESWGCGGNMRPEFYADQYRRYNTFAKNYAGNQLYRIACGANGADYNWTDVVMGAAAKKMDGISLHHYTVARKKGWKIKGSATKFDETEYYNAMERAQFMEELVSRHGAIMDKHDPEKKVGLIVDEWGIWTDVEPGTNPGFLFQQNTMRDAIIASINFDIFHRHADRVYMANIAQMINVLQAMILTDGPKMLLTPTYHVFHMYKVHQDAVSLPLDIQQGPVIPHGEAKIPGISGSASRAADGTIHLSLTNLHASAECAIECTVTGAQAGSAAGSILTAPAINSHNTHEAPDTVKPAAFTAASIKDGKLRLTLPARSIVTLALK